MSTYKLLPPLQQWTADNHGPVVVVSSLCFVIIATITVITRLITRRSIARKFVLDDLFISVAMSISIAQTSSLIIACNYGLGHHRDQIDPHSFEIFGKALYIADILTLFTLAFAKTSVASLIINLHPSRNTLWATYAVMGLTAMWILSGTLAIAFRCGLPDPWNFDGRCIDIYGLDVYNCVLNVITDFGLVLVPTYMMKDVQVNKAKRWLVVALFSSRLLVISFTITATITRRKASTDLASTDFTFLLVESSVWTQLMIALSIMTACLPSIRRFLSELKTGMMGVHISEPLELTMRASVSQVTGTGSKTRSESTASTKLAKIQINVQIPPPPPPSSPREQRGSQDQYRRVQMEQFGGRSVMSTATIERSERSEQVRGLQKNVILQTIDYEVEYQTNDQVQRLMQQSKRHSGSTTYS